MSLVDETAPTDNAHAYSVSELAFALKRTLEDNYGFVRLRGEVSKVTRHANGHIYLDLKDENASIAGVVWRGSVKGLKAQPEQGLEVIVTGRITTFPPPGRTAGWPGPGCRPAAADRARRRRGGYAGSPAPAGRSGACAAPSPTPPP